jgi:hypothetical protein
MIKGDKSAIYKSFLLVFFICFAGTLGLTSCRRRKISSTEASEIFKQNVLDPIPASVTNIQADQTKSIGGSAYALRFNINRADQKLLIESASLERVWNVKYETGSLFVGWDNSGPGGFSISATYLSVYGREGGLREPAWFELENWEDPEAYGIEKKVGGRLNYQVLLYNEKEGEAYYITSVRGRGMW